MINTDVLLYKKTEETKQLLRLCTLVARKWFDTLDAGDCEDHPDLVQRGECGSGNKLLIPQDQMAFTRPNTQFNVPDLGLARQFTCV